MEQMRALCLFQLALNLLVCASQGRRVCIDGFHRPAAELLIRENDHWRTIYRKVSYAEFVCTECERAES